MSLAWLWKSKSLIRRLVHVRNPLSTFARFLFFFHTHYYYWFSFISLVFEFHPKNPNVMNPRVFKIANFFAFNLLFFALYLNFIHKDKNVQQAINASVQTPVATRVASKGSSEHFVQKEASTKNSTAEKENKASKLSFN